jgi:hypothetical protein
MANKNRNDRDRVNTKRPKKRLLLIAIIVIIIFLCLSFWFTKQYYSVDKQLVAIEAACAIPDSENAVTIYNELLKEYDKSIFKPTFLTPELDDLTRKQPWSSKDYPELAKWFEEQQDIIEKLLPASNFGKCLFPILIPLPEGLTARNERLITIHQWALFLVRSANNDIAEGRVDQGLRKYLCSIHMGRHIRQQPVAMDFLVGIVIETLGLQNIRFLIMADDITDEHLQIIETDLIDTDKNWDKVWENVLEVENLYGRKMPKTGSLLKQLKDLWQKRKNLEATLNRIQEIHLRACADHYGSHIMIALRRFKKETGRWPESLEQIKGLVSQDILIDPQNNGPFVYKLTDNCFSLYSIGINNIDEGGRYSKGPDDRPIWPLP